MFNAATVKRKVTKTAREMTGEDMMKVLQEKEDRWRKEEEAKEERKLEREKRMKEKEQHKAKPSRRINIKRKKMVENFEESKYLIYPLICTCLWFLLLQLNLLI